MNSLFPLLKPLCVGAMEVPNRLFMAPLTRCRAEAGHVPGALMAEYYAQRAAAGLIIAEATMAMEGNSAFYSEPGIYNDQQVAGWQKVTQEVHGAGGRIFLQIWHGGRACHPMFNNGTQPVSSSAVAITNDEVTTPEGKKPYVVPRELSDAEIPGIVEGFGKAAERAKDAGFDGVEVHGANGYLLDQFLRDGANKRTGKYGGPLPNRARLLLEVIDSVSDVWGTDRVGVRNSPLNSFNSMSDSDPVGLTTWLGEKLSGYGLAYWHMMRADFLGQQSGEIMEAARAAYRGVLVGNMGYSPQEAASAIEAGKLDAVAFGTPFLANPDLPARVQAGVSLNTPDSATFYTSGAKGYTDYPVMGAA